MNRKASVKKVSFKVKLLVLINLLLAVLLIICAYSNQISPESMWPAAFLGFSFPFILAINIFFMLFWIVFLRLYFLVSVVAIALSWTQFRATFRFPSENKAGINKPLKIMSYNVRLFDIYEWQKKEHPGHYNNEIIDFISSQNPDILCLQEYYTGSRNQINYSDSILFKSQLKYVSIEGIKNRSKTLPFGLATFSTYPIVNSFKQEFSNSTINFCLITDIKIAEDTVRVINTHLESIKFGKEDYNFVNELANNNINNNITDNSKAILAKMARAYRKRAPQSDELARFIEQSPYKVILFGDFNDTPVSYTYHKLSKNLKDAFVEAGFGLGYTYSNFLALRLDYILLDKSIKCSKYRILRHEYSDHYPVMAEISING